MKHKPFSVLFILVAAATWASAQDAGKPAETQPKAPDGWKYITAGDGSYRFLLPAETMRSGTRTQNSRRANLTWRSQINYAVLKDGTMLTIAATRLSGPALKGLKIGDVYKLVIDAEKENNAEVTEPKDFPIGKLKGREYVITKGTQTQRKVLLVVRGRVFEMGVASADKDKTTGATADTFLKSLVIIPKPPPAKGGAKGASGDALPATPPPKIRQKLPPTAAYRPTFQYTDGKEDSGGTAFVIKSPSGKKLAITAAHVLDPKEWAALRSVSLATMAGKKVVDLPGKPAYVGRAFDQLPPLRQGRVPIMNTSEDFAIWVLPDTADVTVLDLAAREPKVNQWVWIAGQQPGKPLLFYRAKVTEVRDGTMLMEQWDRFNPRGFSGGPVLTAEGKVIGTMLAGDQGNMRQGATVGNLLKRIKDR